MKVNQIIESTTSGSIATVAAPLGGTQKRAGSMFTGTTTNKPFYEDGTEVAGLVPAEKVFKGKAKKKGPYANSIVEGKMKELSQDLKELTDEEFKKKYGQTKAEWRASLKEGKGLADKIAGKIQKNIVKSNKAKKDTEEKIKQHQQDQKDTVAEAEITEQDLIVVPGMRRMKDKSFISHKEDRRDHEVEMARSDLYATAKNAMRIFDLLKNRSEEEGLMGWQQSYITLAADYLNSVADSIEYNAKVKGELDEMTGGVIAGGMSNFEEGVAEARYRSRSSFPRTDAWGREERAREENRALTKVYRYDPDSGRVKERSVPYNQISQHYAQGWKDFPEDTLRANNIRHDNDSKKFLQKVGDKEVEVFPYGKPEEKLDEKKDACYSKVKSRYKVWPSAYASGALVKCRKVGAANWGNKSKK